ncbi:MAG TPA: hypothetical protein PLG00_03605, partial [Coprothermobacter proteolyticus]|nr:hypothetical protein [Coprothermobacter proteolyticus]
FSALLDFLFYGQCGLVGISLIIRIRQIYSPPRTQKVLFRKLYFSGRTNRGFCALYKFKACFGKKHEKYLHISTKHDKICKI